MSYKEVTPSSSSLVGTLGQLNDNTGVQYVSLYYNATSSAVSTDVATVMPAKARFSNLYVNLNVNGSTSNCTVTLNVNNVDTALTVTMTALTTGVFSNIIDSVNVNAGDLVCFRLNQSSLIGTAGVVSCRLEM